MQIAPGPQRTTVSPLYRAYSTFSAPERCLLNIGGSRRLTPWGNLRPVQALRAGAVGYVLKSGADRDLVAACRATMHGEPWLYTGAVKALIRDHVETAGKSQKLTDDPLSPRESRVLKLLAESYTRGEIARMLMISESTVDRDRVNIFATLRIRDRTELTRYAIRRGLVEP
jgi:DNA-binding NarL/FixJ family response regulator